MKMNHHYGELKASYLFVDIAHKVAGVEIGPEDRAWLFQALGHHPAVLAVWRSMLQEAIAA